MYQNKTEQIEHVLRHKCRVEKIAVDNVIEKRWKRTRLMLQNIPTHCNGYASSSVLMV